jgi:hypothetical protein
VIKVTFEFKTIEEAIATLGSLMKGAAPVPNVANPAKPEPAGRTRKPRADAGKARGSYKNVGTETDKGLTPEPAVKGAPAEGAVSAPAPESAAPATADAAVTTDGTTDSGKAGERAATPKSTTPDTLVAADPKDAEAALDALFKAKGLPAAQQLLTDSGVKRLRDLPAEKRGEFVQRAKEATK